MLLDLPLEIQLRIYDNIIYEFDLAVYEVLSYHDLGHNSQLSSGTKFKATIIPGSDLALTCRTLHRTISECQDRAFNGILYVNCPKFFWENGLFHRFHKKIRTMYCMNIVEDLRYMPRQFATLLSNLDRLVITDIIQNLSLMMRYGSDSHTHRKSDQVLLYEADEVYREMCHTWSWGDRSKKRKRLRKILEATAIDIRLLEVHGDRTDSKTCGFVVQYQSQDESKNVVARVLWLPDVPVVYWQKGMDRTATSWSDVSVEHELVPEALKWVYAPRTPQNLVRYI